MVWAWVVTAPLGRPVVPEVKMMSDRSPAFTARQAAITSAVSVRWPTTTTLGLDDTFGPGQEFVPAEYGDLVGAGRLREGAHVGATRSVAGSVVAQ